MVLSDSQVSILKKELNDNKVIGSSNGPLKPKLREQKLDKLEGHLNSLRDGLAKQRLSKFLQSERSKSLPFPSFYFRFVCIKGGASGIRGSGFFFVGAGFPNLEA